MPKNRMKISDFPDHIQAQIRAKLAVPPTDLESRARHEAPRKNAPEAFDAPVNITVHSKRKRLADPDGICFKFVLDGIRLGGILEDDSTKEVREVRFTQEKAKEESTKITIEEV